MTLALTSAMHLLHAPMLFVAAALAGILNSVAGGGSFVSFPALIFTGVLPIPANATSTVALWPASVAALGAYRRRLPRSGRVLVAMGLASLLGGMLGAVLLLHTPQATFMHLVSYLFGVATLLFTFGKRLTERVHELLKAATPQSWPVVAGVTFLQLAVAVYGGFFGGGIGILMLALLEMMHMGDIHAMNGVKSLLAAAINGAAVITFIVGRAVVWPQAILMIVGGILGGYSGAHLAQKIPTRVVRGFVISVGCFMTLYFLWKYRTA
jgi:uncharacterized membrane protein YfcA